MARLKRRVIHTVRYPSRYVDETSKKYAKSATAALITADLHARGFRVAPPRGWCHGHERIGWEVDITALI